MTIADLKKRLGNVKSNENCLETLDRVTAHLTSNDIKIDETKLCVGPELVFDPASETFPGNASREQIVDPRLSRTLHCATGRPSVSLAHSLH